jgi:hypothetical protein
MPPTMLPHASLASPLEKTVFIGSCENPLLNEESYDFQFDWAVV